LITIDDLGRARERVRVNLASRFAGQRANLFVNDRFVGFATLSRSGNGTWNLNFELRAGDQLRVSVGGVTRARKTV
jgi:hypothetical protein